MTTRKSALSIGFTKFIEDMYYIRYDFKAHQYNWHFYGGMVLFTLLMWALFPSLGLLSAMALGFVLNFLFWAAKEVFADQVPKWLEKITFGLWKKSKPDWRDCRMSVYGSVLVIILIGIYQLIKYIL